MSYDVYLVDPVDEQVLHLEKLHFMRGGTYITEGTTKLWLNITYNYSKIIRMTLDPRGLYVLDGMPAKQTIFMLEDAIMQLDDNIDEDYWKPTQGNVKLALVYLKTMATLRPDGIWKVF
jgi:hypothetical protein